MGTARPLHKVDRLTDFEARCRILEHRDAERAREILKLKAKCDGWQREAERQKKRAEEVDANATRFHALLLQERIRKVVADAD